MPGALHKIGVYLGLAEDAEHPYDDDGYVDDEPAVRRLDDADDRRGVRRVEETQEIRDVRVHSYAATPYAPPAYEPVEEASPEAYRITTLIPRTYNDAKLVGENFRDGIPVIMNLTEMDDADAKRLVDFAAGLIFGLRGSIERITSKVFLLSPYSVEVTAEDKARFREEGFFNQS